MLLWVLNLSAELLRFDLEPCADPGAVMCFRPFHHGGKRTLYLVDTVATVAQQASYIRHLTDLSVGEYASSDTVDVFNIDDWMQELQENQVFLVP
jgi:hypothetical protein